MYKTKSESIFVENSRKKVGKALQKYNLIDEGDRVLVALSGGKDSLSMLEMLANRRKIIPVTFELFALHVDLEDVPYQIDVEYLQHFCAPSDVPFYQKKVSGGLLSKKNHKTEKSTCFLCSRNRRKELFIFAKELKCNKIALGHHMDDAVETLIMNMIYHAQISSIPTSLNMFEGTFELIRPLMLLTEAELKRYSKLLGFQKLNKNCPFENTTKRKIVKDLINQISQIKKDARINIFKSMANICENYLIKN